MDNQQVAILTKVNELGERFGIKPWEMLAEVRLSPDEDSPNLILSFSSPPEEKGAQYQKMLEAIGGDKARDVLEGTPQQILEAFDVALHVAPKPRRM